MFTRRREPPAEVVLYVTSCCRGAADDQGLIGGTTRVGGRANQHGRGYDRVRSGRQWGQSLGSGQHLTVAIRASDHHLS